jgi:hypothetical protein
VLSAAGLAAIVDAVIEGPDRGWGSVTTLVEVCAGAMLIAAFIVRELRAANPLIDVRVFKHRAFSAATISIALTMFALFGSLFALTQYLQLVVGYSPLSAGLRALPFAAGVMVLAPVSSILVRAAGARVVVPLGLTGMSAGLFILTQVDAASGYGVIALGIAVMGIGMGLTLAPAGESIMSVLPPEQAGVGSAVNDTVQELGGSLGVAVIGSIVSASFRHGLDSSHPGRRRSPPEEPSRGWHAAPRTRPTARTAAGSRTPAPAARHAAHRSSPHARHAPGPATLPTRTCPAPAAPRPAPPRTAAPGPTPPPPGCDIPPSARCTPRPPPPGQGGPSAHRTQLAHQSPRCHITDASASSAGHITPAHRLYSATLTPALPPEKSSRDSPAVAVTR